MRNKENIGHIVRDKHAITSLSIMCQNIYYLLIHHLSRSEKTQKIYLYFESIINN